MASSLVPAVLAYILVVYSHLSDRNLAQAATKASVRNAIRCRPSHLPETITALIGRLELLLQQTSARLSSIRRVNLVVEIVLWNSLVRTEDAAQRVEDDIDIAGERIRLAETVETRVDGLWAIWDLITESEHLQEEIERARSQVEAFGETVGDPAPTEADENAYEDLKTKIGSLILFLSSVM